MRPGGQCSTATAVDVVLPAAVPHALTADDVVRLFEVDPVTGLTEAEAAARQLRYGPNVLPAMPSAGVVERLARQVHNPLVYVLLTAGVITLFLGELVDSSVISGVVVLNTVIGFVQESKAEPALGALRAIARTDARVIRAGHTYITSSEVLVPAMWSGWRRGTRCRPTYECWRMQSFMSTSRR